MGNVKNILESIGVKPSKGRGQNFIQSKHEADILAHEANIKTDSTVLEIGPGLGILTHAISAYANKIVCVEIEKSFVDYLKKEFQQASINFIHSDFRDINLPLDTHDKNYQVVSNIPYVLSSEVLFWLIKNVSYIHSASLLVQREFAERVVAKPSTKAYGSPSVQAQYWFSVNLGRKVPGSIFYPAAKVESYQLHLQPKPCDEREKVNDLIFFEKLVRASFSTRRKKLSKCLSMQGITASTAQAESILTKLNLNPTIRGEALEVSDYIKLSNYLSSGSKT